MASAPQSTICRGFAAAAKDFWPKPPARSVQCFGEREEDQMTTSTIRERLDSRLEELKTLRDEIRVELHLASRDLRDEWEGLEKQIPDSRALADQLKGSRTPASRPSTGWRTTCDGCATSYWAESRPMRHPWPR